MNRKDFSAIYNTWNRFLKENKENEIEFYKEKSNFIEKLIIANEIKIIDVDCELNISKNIPEIKSITYSIKNEEEEKIIAFNAPFPESIEFYQEFLNQIIKDDKKEEVNFSYQKHKEINAYGYTGKPSNSVIIKAIKFDALMKVKKLIFDDWAIKKNFIDFSHYLADTLLKEVISFKLIGEVNQRSYLLVENTKTDGNVCFYKRSGKGHNPSNFLKKYRNDVGEGCWLPIGGIGNGESLDEYLNSGWIVKIPPTCNYANKFSGDKFPEIFTEIYYIGIALKLKGISVTKRDIDTTAKSLNLISASDYISKIYTLSESLPIEKKDIKLTRRYCLKTLLDRFGEIIVNKFLKKHNALKEEWFNFYSKAEKPLGIDSSNHKFDFNDNKKDLWIETLKIHDIEIFTDNFKSGKIDNDFSDYNKG